MHQDLLQLQACQNPFDDQKHKSQGHDTLKPSLIDALGHVDQNYPFLENSWAIFLSLDRNDINNFGPKGHLSKTIPILRSDAPIWKALYGMCRCPEQMSHKKKIDCHVMHLKNSIKPKWESRMSEKNDEKSHKRKSFSFYKESLFSLDNYVWYEKWSSFIILSLI